MTTSYIHRILLIVPVAKVAAVVSWFQTNIGANSVDPQLGPGLSVSGSAPATYNWMCGSFIDSECRLILFKLCQLAAIVPPTQAQWNSWTRPQKIAWLQSVQAAILLGYGAWVDICDNEGNWMNAASEALAQLNVIPIQS